MASTIYNTVNFGLKHHPSNHSKFVEKLALLLIFVNLQARCLNLHSHCKKKGVADNDEHPLDMQHWPPPWCGTYPSSKARARCTPFYALSNEQVGNRLRSNGLSSMGTCWSVSIRRPEGYKTPISEDTLVLLCCPDHMFGKTGKACPVLTTNWTTKSTTSLSPMLARMVPSRHASAIPFCDECIRIIH